VCLRDGGLDETEAEVAEDLLLLIAEALEQTLAHLGLEGEGAVEPPVSPSAVRRAMTARRSVGSGTRSTRPAASRPSTTPVVVRGTTLQARAIALICAPASPWWRMIASTRTCARESPTCSKVRSSRKLTFLSATETAAMTSARVAETPRWAKRSRICGEKRRPRASRSSPRTGGRAPAGGGAERGIGCGMPTL